MSTSKKKPKEFPRATIVEDVRSNSSPSGKPIGPKSYEPKKELSVEFEEMPDVKSLFTKMGLGSVEQARLKAAIKANAGNKMFEADLYTFRRAVSTILITYFDEEPAQWVDSFIGSWYSELTDYVPQGA